MTSFFFAIVCKVLTSQDSLSLQVLDDIVKVKNMNSIYHGHVGNFISERVSVVIEMKNTLCVNTKSVYGQDSLLILVVKLVKKRPRMRLKTNRLF